MTEQKQTNRYRKQTQWGGINEKPEMNTYTLLYIRYITNKDLTMAKETLLNIP